MAEENLWLKRANPQTHVISLRVVGSVSDFRTDRRLLALHPTGPILIGRGRKSCGKTMPKTTNAFFLNPVVSRSHATIENRSGLVLYSSTVLTQ
jgi:hypothetical protein